MAKRVMQYNLRQDQSYKYVGYEYIGGEDFNLCSCDNCNRQITNLYYIVGSLDNKTYCVGSECVGTLTKLLNPSDYLEAKRLMKKEIKYIKWLKTECKFALHSEREHRGETTDTLYLYDSMPGDWLSSAKYRFNFKLDDAREQFEKFFSGSIITKQDINKYIYDKGYAQFHNMDKYLIDRIPDGVILDRDRGMYDLENAKGAYANTKETDEYFYAKIIYADGRESYYGVPVKNTDGIRSGYEILADIDSAYYTMSRGKKSL